MKKILLLIFIIFNSYNVLSQSTVHKVSSGESLSIISNKYDVPVEDIKEFNGLECDLIFIDQILEIPDKDYYQPVIDIYNSIDLNIRFNIRRIYNSQLGIRELTGNNDGVDVQKYLNSAGLEGNYPWCAAFAYWVLEKVDMNPDLQYPAWVPSYFPKDKLIYVRGEIEKREPIIGDLIGIWFSNKNRLAHIGFYDGQNDKYYFTVEGNTNDAGSREGDGVYRKRRIKRQVHSISSWIEEKK